MRVYYDIAAAELLASPQVRGRYLLRAVPAPAAAAAAARPTTAGRNGGRMRPTARRYQHATAPGPPVRGKGDFSNAPRCDFPGYTSRTPGRRTSRPRISVNVWVRRGPCDNDDTTTRTARAVNIAGGEFLLGILNVYWNFDIFPATRHWSICNHRV